MTDPHKGGVKAKDDDGEDSNLIQLLGGLFKKCQNKFGNHDGFHRGLSVDAIQSLAKNAFDNVMEIESYKDFNWDIYYPLESNN